MNENIIPFFEKYQMQTSKQNDFLLFKKVLQIMYTDPKRDEAFVKRVSKIISLMNTKKKRRI